MILTNHSAALEQYRADHRGYPTTEQGLYALVFTPDSAGMPLTVPQPSGIPGVPGQDDGGMMDGSQSIGTGTSMSQPNLPMSSMVQGQTGAMDSTTGQSMFDSMASGSMGTGGAMTSASTQPFYNPQLYTRQQKRTTPYIQEKDLIDPWRNPYRYDNSRTYSGLNATGSDRPAIWSAGPDGIDNTADDIHGWNIEEANQAIARHQQLLQQQGNGSGFGQQGSDPMSNMQFDPNNQMMQQQFGQPTPQQQQFGQPTPQQQQFGQPTPSQQQFGQPTPSPQQFGQPTPSPQQFGQ